MSFNLSVLVRDAAREAPDRPAVIHDTGVLSYGELNARSDELARGLARSGVRNGDVVGLQLPNVPEFVVSLYGILKAGAVAVPVNVLNKGPELAYVLQNSHARALITHVDTLTEALKGAREASTELVVAVGAGMLAEGVQPFEDIVAQGREGEPCYPYTEPGDAAVLLYTSGTTGKPKGVILTHFQLFMNAAAHRDAFSMNAGTKTIAVMPLFHALGLSGLLNATFLGGGAVVLLPKFDATAVLEAIQKHQATVLHGVPTMYHALLNHPDARSYDTSSLQQCGSAGAAIAAEVLDHFESTFGVAILEMYGLTESGPLASFNRPDRRKPYSIGLPLWGTDIEIWDDELHRLPAGREHVGEIVIRGHNTMAGYLDNEAATAEAFKGGWLHTGDLGFQDEEGFLFIVGRKKELIIRGGYNVYPREVEEVLYQHPAVVEAAVVGVPDERLGEEVAAYVAVKPGASVTESDLIGFVRDRVAAYKYPRAVTFLPELPKTASGKILKLELTKSA